MADKITGRRTMRATDEARWKFIPTSGIVKQAPKAEQVPCTACGGTGVFNVPGLMEDNDACLSCDATGKVSRVRLVPFVVRSPITALRENIARAWAVADPYTAFAEPRRQRVDDYARGVRSWSQVAA